MLYIKNVYWYNKKVKLSLFGALNKLYICITSRYVIYSVWGKYVLKFNIVSHFP